MLNGWLRERTFGTGSDRNGVARRLNLSRSFSTLSPRQIQIRARVDPFSYIIVLTSIILGLGVTRVVGRDDADNRARCARLRSDSIAIAQKQLLLFPVAGHLAFDRTRIESVQVLFHGRC